MIREFTEEQDELRTTVRKFLSDHSDETEVRRLMDTEQGYDPEVWQTMAAQLGLQGIAIPEEYGGQGFGWPELGIVLEEMGRALLCAPFFSSVVLAANTLLASEDTDAKQRFLPGIADGSVIATLAFPRPGTPLRVKAEQADGGWRLTGTAPLVTDAHVAQLLLVAADTGDGLGLFAVEAGTDGLRTTLRPTLDQTRKLADVELTGAAATPLGEPGNGAKTLARALDLAAVGLAAEQVGGAQAALDMGVEYMKVRVQFGQPIGAFQALKHMAADALVEVETARSAAYYALFAAEDDSDELPVAASLAAAYCTDAFVSTAHQNIQFHGGMGFTWEIPAHLYFKRARSSQLLLGEPEYHRAQVAERLGF
ncbi:acyl-CoA dehydrogenase family protein [Streptomyces mexicanus]|uniref:Acyl-CoA/acyl-ACP dehydrogenase n=1 Tax=Streptomyces mexicanus TaxID=178566 RepID=A0A7X1HXV1_9ACTN|nr:acyl-CoA dehydrogenase family protein [Streptomyces mexicanus]MBC2865037.1 acyl-CoA/acyl-ACP dehydrogenase [Streptomyces mexicanus]